MWVNIGYMYIPAECTVQNMSLSHNNTLESYANCTMYVPEFLGKHGNRTEEGDSILNSGKENNPYNIENTYNAKALYDIVDDVILYVVWPDFEITYCPKCRSLMGDATAILTFHIISIIALCVLAVIYFSDAIWNWNTTNIDEKTTKCTSVGVK